MKDDKNSKAKDLDGSRRRFLKNAGKVAVYTPPAMLAMSSPSFEAIAQSSSGGDETPRTTPPGQGQGQGQGGRRRR